jgi:hypothetical protein
MASTREQVREALEQKSDEEADEILTFVRQIERRRDAERIFERLRGHPSFRVPPPGWRCFRRFEPIEVSGKPAPEMLIEDRR